MKLFPTILLVFVAFSCTQIEGAPIPAPASFWDQLPIVSQIKSLVQVIGGDDKGARETQENFSRGIFLPATAVRSIVEAASGDSAAAGETWKSAGKGIESMVDGLPAIGHIKGSIHYAVGDNKRGDEIMKSASRTTGVMVGDVAGFAAGGPAGAAAGGVVGGTLADSLISAVDSAVNREDRPYGHMRSFTDMANGNTNVGHVFDSVLNIGGDAAAGWGAGGTFFPKPGLKSGTFTPNSQAPTFHSLPGQFNSSSGLSSPPNSIYTGATSVNPSFNNFGGFGGTSIRSAPTIMQTVPINPLQPPAVVLGGGGQKFIEDTVGNLPAYGDREE